MTWAEHAKNLSISDLAATVRLIDVSSKISPMTETDKAMLEAFTEEMRTRTRQVLTALEATK
jgi:hypothetical protein